MFRYGRCAARLISALPKAPLPGHRCCLVVRSRQGTTNRDLGAPMKTIGNLAVAGLFTILALPASARANCDDDWWGTADFLDNATADTVAACLEAGADVNARLGSDGGFTPLHLARLNLHPGVAHRLLELGADPAARNDQGQVADPTSCEYWNTPHFARTASAEAWSSCLEEGADVNARRGNGNTPLLFATMEWGGGTVGAPASEGPAVVQMLLGAGADVNARNGDGDTPLLHAAGAHVDPDPDSGTRRIQSPGIVSLLLEAGPDVNVRSKRGGTPLHQAAAAGGSETVALLLEAGAEVNARNEGGSIGGLQVRRLGHNPAAQCGRGGGVRDRGHAAGGWRGRACA